MRSSLLFALLVCLTTAACNGPGPLTPWEVRWRWTHGELLDVVEINDINDIGMRLTVRCPAEQGGVFATFTVWSSQQRALEAIDPLARKRDALKFAGWRYCEQAAADEQTGVKGARP